MNSKHGNIVYKLVRNQQLNKLQNKLIANFIISDIDRMYYMLEIPEVLKQVDVDKLVKKMDISYANPKYVFGTILYNPQNNLSPELQRYYINLPQNELNNVIHWATEELSGSVFSMIDRFKDVKDSPRYNDFLDVIYFLTLGSDSRIGNTSKKLDEKKLMKAMQIDSKTAYETYKEIMESHNLNVY